MEIARLEGALDQSMIAAVQGEQEDMLVTHWTTVMTVMQTDGTELMLTLDRPGQSVWQSAGLIEVSRDLRKSLVQQSGLDHDHDDFDDE